MIAVVQPKTDIVGFPEDCRDRRLKSRRGLFVSVEEQDPIGFEVESLKHPIAFLRKATGPSEIKDRRARRLGYLHSPVGARQINHHDVSEAIERGEAF